MRNRRIVSLVLVAAILAACGGSKPTPTPVPAAPARSTPLPAQPTAQPTAGGKEGPTLQPTVPSAGPTSQTEEGDLSQATNLDKLDAYYASYSWSWSEIKEGEITSGYWIVLEEYSKADSARHIGWTGDEGTLEIIQIGPFMYTRKDDGAWTSMLTSDSDFLASSGVVGNPLGLIVGDKGRLVERGVTVNGVIADHYTLEQSSGSALLTGVPDTVSGDVYVSPEFQVVVKYAAKYEGKTMGITGGTEGRLEVGFDLKDINRRRSIFAPPDVAPPIPEDIPIMEGATDLTAVSGVVSYKTARSVADVTAFYNEAMPRMGWQAGQGAVEGVLSFSKDQRQATVMMQAEGGMTTVTVIAGQ